MSKTIKNRKGHSISTKISLSLMAALIPSMVILIIVSCIIAANSISDLNDKVLEAQTDNVVSIVDGFFTNKLTAVKMFEQDDILLKFFQETSITKKFESYSQKSVVVNSLSSALERMKGENVQEAWVASTVTDSLLLSSGEISSAGFADLNWDDEIMSKKEPVITEPYIDPVTGQRIISIVAPVFSSDGTTVMGMMGFDVFMDSLAASLSGIRIGENGYMELLSNSSEYIYSEDPTAIGKSVSQLEIDDIYKQNIQNKYEGITDFTYAGIAYTSLSRKCESTGWLTVATIPMNEINSTRNQLIIAMALLSVAIVAILVLVIVMIIRKAIGPLIGISDNMEEFSHGNLQVEITATGDDEIGRLAQSARTSITTLKNVIQDISGILSEMSNGNLSVKVDGAYFIGDLKPIQTALTQIIQSLNKTLGQINQSSDQVSGGADQVSSGAQALSQGAAEQASSIEELAATITEISDQIKRNAQNAVQASDQMKSVGSEANESSRRMQDMLEAMNQIKESSGEISKIIKTIEDIAFQTNILALNAAVEAARAGAAGKGFAVVADEVRNLANKSQEASKNTSVLIENSLRAVENGTMIADKTARSLTAVVKRVGEVGETIGLISDATIEQSHNIEQVTQGMDQISSVVQTNSATAEESAAASEELSGQAQILKRLVGQFQLDSNSEVVASDMYHPY